MHAEIGTVIWPTVFVTVSIALAVVLVVRKKVSGVGRSDSVQYIFTATVKARTPGVTYLDFPAPPPPNRDREAVGYGPTILRTFGRTLTKLRFSNTVDVKTISNSATSAAAQQRRHNRATMLQITPIHDVPGSTEGFPLHESVLPTSSNSLSTCRETSTSGHMKTVRREPTPGPSALQRELTRSSSIPHEPTPIPSTLRREPTLGPSASRREPTPGPSTRCREPTPGGDSFDRESMTNVLANASLSSSDPDGERSGPGSVTRPYSPTGYSNTDIMSQLVRNKRFSGKIGDGPDAIRVMMYWWETTSPERIQTPPDLSRRQELRLGDLFLHRHDDGIQIWICSEGRDGHAWRWKKIPVGYVRVDGRILAFTEVNKQPSWLDPDWHSTRRRQRRL